MSEHTLITESSLVTVSSAGGMVTSFQVGGVDIIFPQIKLPNDSIRGGEFGAFPWFGKDSRFEGQHGFLRNLEPLEDQAFPSRSIFQYQHDGSRRYPWKVIMKVDTLLGSKFLSRKMSISLPNRSEWFGNLPIIRPGFHPYFAGKVSEVRVMTGWESLTGFSREASLHQIDPSQQIYIETPQYIVEMSLTDGFRHGEPVFVVLWTDNSEKYFCVEPIFGLQKGVEMEESFIFGMNLIVKIK